MRTAELELHTGLTVKLQMPNMYALFAKSGSGIPNPAIASIYRLLEGSEALQAQGIMQRFSSLNEFYRGLYEIAALCLVTPKLRLEGTPGEGEIGPDDLCWNDLYRIYFQFFCSHPTARLINPDVRGSGTPADGTDVDGAAADMGDGEHVPHPTEHAAGN